MQKFGQFSLGLGLQFVQAFKFVMMLRQQLGFRAF
jgi:hypothetical protein